MVSVKKATSPTGKRFCEYLAALIDASEMTQLEMSRELGYDNPNIVSMWKRGVLKVPVEKLPMLAKILGVDPAHMARIALREYHPDFYATLEQIFGHSVTKNEFDVIKTIRKITRNTDPSLDSDRVAHIEKAFAA